MEIKTELPDSVPTDKPDPTRIELRQDYQEAAMKQPGVPLSETRPLNSAEIQGLISLETGDLTAQQVNGLLLSAILWHNSIADPNNIRKRARSHEIFAGHLARASDDIRAGCYSEASHFLLNLARLRYGGEEAPIEPNRNESFYDQHTNPFYLPKEVSPEEIQDSADKLVKFAAILAKNIKSDVSHTL